MKSIVAKWLVSHVAFLIDRTRVHSFPHTLFSWFVAVFPDLDFLRQVLWPIQLCLCLRRCRLNWVFGSQNVRGDFFLRLLDHPGRQTRLHIYQWVAHPTHGSVCKYCDRMMDGHTLDDLILERGMFVDRGRSGSVCSPCRPQATGMGWLALAHNVSHQFIPQGQWLHSWPWFSHFECFLGTHCLLRHHTQWIRPLHIGLYHTSISTLIRLSASF